MGQKQHFIPRFYLSAFVDPETPSGHEPYVWIADLKNRSVSKKAPRSIARENNFYEPSKAAGFRPEEFLHHFESKAAPLLRRVDAGHSLSDDQERFDLTIYVALQLTRTRHFREQLPKWADATALKVAKAAFDRLGKEAQDKLGFSWAEISERPPRLVVTRDFEIGISMKLALERVAPVLFPANWTFVRAPAVAAFLTTEQPVSLLTSDARPCPFNGADGLLNADLTVAFVVSPRTLLLVHTDQAEVPATLTSGQVEGCNHGLLRAAPNWAFANSRTLAEWAICRDVSEPPPERIPATIWVD